MNYNFQQFEEKLSQLQLTLTDRMKEQFAVYYDMLCEWNKIMNLTTIIQFDEVVEKHFVDSLALGAYLELKDHCTMIDIGTGAGFPGIPLKIVYPDLNVLLVDSLNKRVRFLEEVIQKLHLTGITSVHGRAEELAHKNEYREQYDLCVSRAVAHLASLSEYCLPFVKTGGTFAAYKSADISDEIEQSKKAIQILGGKINRIETFQLPETEYGRSFVIIDKVKHISKKYPRKSGTPGRCPLQ